MRKGWIRGVIDEPVVMKVDYDVNPGRIHYLMGMQSHKNDRQTDAGRILAEFNAWWDSNLTGMIDRGMT